MNVISQLLMGLDVEQYPPFKSRSVRQCIRTYRVRAREQGADEAALYEHALGFLDRFIRGGEARGVPVRHRLDAQSLGMDNPSTRTETRGKGSR